MASRAWWLTVVGSVFGVALVACNRLPGRVLDSDTGRPIVGATVQVKTEATCGHPPVFPNRRIVQDRVTDEAGWFEVSSRSPLSPCMKGARILLHAAGHLPEEDQGFGSPRHILQGWLRDPIRLDPLRYRSELRAIDDDIAALEQRYADFGDQRSGLIEALQRSRPSALRWDAPGVFVEYPAARFDQVATTFLEPASVSQRSTAVLARDATTGRIHVWNGRGDAVDMELPTSARSIGAGYFPDGPGPNQFIALITGDAMMLPARPFWSLRNPRRPMQWISVPSQRPPSRVALLLGLKRHPPGADTILTLEGKGDVFGLYDWRSVDGVPVGTSVEPVALLPTAAVLPDGPWTVECLTMGKSEGPYPVPGYRSASSSHRGVVVTRSSSERRVFVLDDSDHHGMPIARALPSLDGRLSNEVTACAADDRHLYVGTHGGGILRVPFAATEHSVTIGQTIFGDRSVLGIALGSVQVLGAPRTVVYAVAGDGVVYRFLADGSPDARLASAS